MPALVAPEDLPSFVPGRILARSDGLDWDGVSLRSYAYKGQDVEVPAMRDFMLVSYQVGVTPMERRFDGRWTQTTCGPGAMSLLTRSQVSHWHWTEDVNVTHVYLTQDFVSGVAREVVGRAVEDVRLADVLRTDDPILTGAVRTIAQEVAQGGLGGALYVDAVARQLVIHLLRRYAEIRVGPVERSGGLSPSQQRLVTAFIDANLHAPLTLETLAAELKMGACTFSRHFHRAAGQPPYAFVMDRRLARARDLLAQTAMPIKQIAAQCGFSDQSHLTRLFSKRFGSPPAAFRKGRAGTQVSMISVATASTASATAGDSPAPTSKLPASTP